MTGFMSVKELKKILNKYKDTDLVALSIINFDEEGASAEVTISYQIGKRECEDPILKRSVGCWGF